MQTTVTFRPRSVFVNPSHFFLAMTAIAVLALAATVFAPPAAQAMQFNMGPVEGSLDTTASCGASIRVGERNPELIAVSNGGKANTSNGDDGNLNFGQWDLVSLNAKVLHEMDLNWKNFGFFGRMYYFYDWAIMEFDPDRTAFSESAQRRAGMDIRFLDAYVKGDFNVFGLPVTLRVGNMVLNWGESTFIQNGISVINPVDVSALRVAGAELREALLPVPMVQVSAGITENLSIEGFYQLYWENTEIEPQGTFFSTTDTFSPGGSRAFLAFGKNPPHGPKDYPPTEVFSPLGPYVPRTPDREPDHQGQGGVALRYFASWLNETEFGAYYIRFHSRLPVGSTVSGPEPAVTANPTNADELIALLQYGLSSGDFGKTCSVFREFPEDLDLFGVSFSTEIPFGIAAQGEVSYHRDQPIQVHTAELVFATLSPMDEILNSLNAVQNGAWPPPDPDAPIFGNSQLGSYDFNEYVQGFRRKDFLQPQLTLTKVFGPTLGTDQIVVLGEGGATLFFDMESKKKLRYDGPGTATSGNPVFLPLSEGEEWSDRPAALIEMPGITTEGFADSVSWGYRVAMRFDFNNAIGPINLKPSVAFAHDVDGTTPGPGGNFVEDRKTLTGTLTAEYLNRLRFIASYTNYMDAGPRNSLNDRDFVSVAASLSF